MSQRNIQAGINLQRAPIPNSSLQRQNNAQSTGNTYSQVNKQSTQLPHQSHLKEERLKQIEMNLLSFSPQINQNQFQSQNVQSRKLINSTSHPQGQALFGHSTIPVGQNINTIHNISLGKNTNSISNQILASSNGESLNNYETINKGVFKLQYSSSIRPPISENLKTKIDPTMKIQNTYNIQNNQNTQNFQTAQSMHNTQINQNNIPPRFSHSQQLTHSTGQNFENQFSKNQFQYKDSLSPNQFSNKLLTSQRANDENDEIDDAQFVERIPTDEDLNHNEIYDEQDDVNEEDFVEDPQQAYYSTENNEYYDNYSNQINQFSQFNQDQNDRNWEANHQKDNYSNVQLDEFISNVDSQSKMDNHYLTQRNSNNYLIQNEYNEKLENQVDTQSIESLNNDFYSNQSSNIQTKISQPNYEGLKAFSKKTPFQKLNQHASPSKRNTPISSQHSPSPNSVVLETVEDIPKHLQKELTSRIRQELSSVVQKELQKIRKESEKIMQQELQGLSQVDILKNRIFDLETKLNDESNKSIQLNDLLEEKSILLSEVNSKHISLQKNYEELEIQYKNATNTIIELEKGLSDKTRIIVELEQKLNHIQQRKLFEEQYESSKEQKQSVSQLNNPIGFSVSYHGAKKEELNSIDTMQSEWIETENEIKRIDTLELNNSIQRLIPPTEKNLGLSQNSHTSRLQALSGSNITKNSFDQWIEEESISEPQHESILLENQNYDTVITDLLNYDDPQAIARTLIDQARDPQFKQPQFSTTLSHGHTTGLALPNISLPQTVKSPGTPNGRIPTIPETINMLNKSGPVSLKELAFEKNKKLEEDNTPKRSRFGNKFENLETIEDIQKKTKVASSKLNIQNSVSDSKNIKQNTKSNSSQSVSNSKQSNTTTSQSKQLTSTKRTKYEEALKQSFGRKSPSKKNSKSKDRSIELKETLDTFEATIQEWQNQQTISKEDFIHNVNTLKAFLGAISHKDLEFGEISTRISKLLDMMYSIWENLETSYSDRFAYTSNIINVLQVDVILSSHVLLQNLQLVENDLGKVIQVSTQELLKQSQIINLIKQRENLNTKIESLSMKKSSDRTSLIQQLKQLDKDLTPELQSWYEKEGLHFEFRGIPYETILRYQSLKKEFQQLENEMQHIMKWAKRSGV